MFIFSNRITYLYHMYSEATHGNTMTFHESLCLNVTLRFQKQVFYKNFVSIPDISSNEHSCLKVDQENTITDCSTNQLQDKSLCVKFDVSSTVNATDQRCRNQDKEIGNKLYDLCINTKRNGNCVYNLARILTTDLKHVKLLPPTKKISIMYSCKGNEGVLFRLE